MTEKELIRTALENKAPCPYHRSSAEIIAEEGKGAQAHIRKRRFTFITVAAAAAVAISAAVLLFKKLGENKPDVGRDMSSAAEDDSSREDSGNIVKLCDFTGTETMPNVDLVRNPDNLYGYTVRIRNNRISLYKGSGDENGSETVLMSDNDNNCIMKAYTANVTGGVRAELCVEAKASYNTEDSAVYIYDIENDKYKVYYIPGYMSFKLDERDGKLMLGSRISGEDDYTYEEAAYDFPARYRNAQLDYLNSQLDSLGSYEEDRSVWYMSYGSGMQYIGGGMYCNRELTGADVQDAKDSEAVKKLTVLIKNMLNDSKLSPELKEYNTSDSYSIGYTDYAELVSVSTSEYSTLVFGRTNSKDHRLSIFGANFAGNAFQLEYTPDSSTVTEETLSGLRPEKMKGTQNTTVYTCPDIASTRYAERMLVPQSGAYAISYHFETDADGKNYFVIDGIQLAKGKTFGGGNLLIRYGETQQEGDELRDVGSFGRVIEAEGVTDMIGKPIELDTTGPRVDEDSIEVYCSLYTDENLFDTVYDRYKFTGSDLSKEYIIAADLTKEYGVTRLSDGSQIRFDRDLDVFPGTKISVTDTTVTAGDKKIVSGTHVRRVFAEDLNGDEKAEVIAECYKSDPQTDSFVSVYDLASGESTVIELDKASLVLSYNYLALHKNDEERETPLKYASEEWNKQIAMNVLRYDLNCLDRAEEQFPGQSVYDVNYFSYYTNIYDRGDISDLEGKCIELPQITKAVKEALDSGECEAVRMSVERGDGYYDEKCSLQYYVIATVQEDDSYGFRSKYGANLNLYYYAEQDRFGADIGLESDPWIEYLVLLPKSVNSSLDFMLPEKYSFASIEHDGSEGIMSYYDVKDWKDIKIKTASVNDDIEIEMTFDAEGEKGTFSIDRINTAEGVTVEQSDICLCLEDYSWEYDGDEIKRSTTLPMPFRKGSKDFEIVIWNEKTTADMLTKAYIKISMMLKLPDGTEREVYRNIELDRDIMVSIDFLKSLNNGLINAVLELNDIPEGVTEVSIFDFGWEERKIILENLNK